MKLSKLVLYSVGAFVAVAAIGALTSPKLAAAIRAAYVEVVIPSQPFHSLFNLTQDFTATVGPGTGTLGVTNITLTNEDSSTHEVTLYQAVGGPAGSCSSGPGLATNDQEANVIVQPNSTLVIPFPTPWVMGNVRGQTCIGAQIIGGVAGNNDAVGVSVTGFVN